MIALVRLVHYYFIVSAPVLKSFLVVFIHNYMYISYVTMEMKIRRGHDLNFEQRPAMKSRRSATQWQRSKNGRRRREEKAKTIAQDMEH